MPDLKSRVLPGLAAVVALSLFCVAAGSAIADHTYNPKKGTPTEMAPRAEGGLPADQTRKLVFLSSKKYRGKEVGGWPEKLGALGGDALCQGLAKEAGIEGTFMAWISDSTTSPDTRFTKAEVPYALLDGTKVADDWRDLTDGTLDHHIQIDETWMRPAFEDNIYAWTSTRSDGTADHFTCNDWKEQPCRDCLAYVGHGELNFVPDHRWSRFVTVPCVYPSRLYCFEQ